MTLINYYMLNIHQTERQVRACYPINNPNPLKRGNNLALHTSQFSLLFKNGEALTTKGSNGQGRLNLLLVLLYLCIQPWTLQAQNDIVLKDPVVGNASVTAPNSITLAAGFRTISGSVFSASIGPVQTTGGSTAISAPSSSVTPVAGTTGQNFIKTITYREAQTSVPSSTTSFKNNEVIQYIDGLGRPIQTVNVGASPSGNDIIQPVFYDNYGREVNKALPYTAAKSGDFRTGVSVKTLNTYYGTGSTSPLAVVDTSAYSKTGFENSPLNRVLTQTAPGVDWKSKPVTFNYLTNTDADAIPGWTVTGNYTYSAFTYAAASLYATETIDEEGNTTREYKDKQGQVVLKESKLGTNWLRTAYIYDDLGLLRCVVPPAASDPTDQGLCYYYLYDSRNRMIEKKIPGGGTIKMVYDKRDRLRGTQNSEQAITNDWSFIKYDGLNRAVITGVLKNHTMDTAQVNSGTISETQNNVASTKGYTNVSFPGSTLTTEFHIVTFYDNYDFITPLGLSDSLTFAKYTDVYGVTSKKDDTPVGRVTGTMTSVLPGDANTTVKTELYSTLYYDKYGHVLRTISENHLYGKDITSNNYEDITWLVTKTRQEHYKGAEKISIDKKMEYDHTGRLLATKQKVNTQDTITLNAMQYNEVGQLVTKYLHSAQTTGTLSFLQKVDYQYNIRGWLTKINDPGLDSDNDLFGMQLNYNTTDGMGSLVPAKTLFNGNIAAMRWNIKGDLQRGYAFTYDMLNRLTYSKYADGASLANSAEYYSESVPAYDDNGNITRLKRNYNNILVDDLTYAYTTATNTAKSNQVKQIADAGTPNANVDDYPGTSGTYTYDTNGNMNFDGSRNTTLLYHRTLNLPQYVDFGNSNLIYYSYTATGNKLVKHVQSGSTNNYTHYIGNVVYENGTLSYISTEEGRLMAIGTGTDRRFINEYELKDHLGNNRVAFMGTSLGGAIDVVQTTNYYPFGLVMNQTNSNTDPSYQKNKYLYNGKELQNDNLNGTFFGLIDYGARFYDPTIARWTTIDPLAEKSRRWSPYNYCVDNPIRVIDPDGKEIKYIIRDDNDKVVQTYVYKNGGFYDKATGNKYDVAKGKDFTLTRLAKAYGTIEKSSDKILKNQLHTLEKSDNVHWIEKSPNGENAVSGLAPVKENGSSSTQTEFTFDKKNEKEDVGIVAHEMRHQFDNDIGNTKDDQKENTAKDHSEIRATNNENRGRKLVGLDPLTTYDGVKIDPKLLANPPNNLNPGAE